MAETVTDADLRALLDVVDAARRADPGPLPAPPDELFEQLGRVVACDSMTFLDLDLDRRAVVVEQDHDPDGADGADLPDDDAFWRHYDGCLGCSYPTASGDSRSITTMSDFYSQREYHATGMYAEYLGPLQVEHEAMLCLPAPAGRSRRLVFFRSGGCDFDSRDRLLLALLRPHLVEVDRELTRRAAPGASLTPRQSQLLRLVARGDSNTEIARALDISPGTVRKHLENIYARLGVMSRTSAVARALVLDHVEERATS